MHKPKKDDFRKNTFSIFSLLKNKLGKSQNTSQHCKESWK